MKKHYLLLTIIGITLLLVQITIYMPTNDNITVKQGFKKENINRVGKAQPNYTLTKLYSKSTPLFSPLEDNKSLLPMPNTELGDALTNQSKLLKIRENEKKGNFYSDNQLDITYDKLNKSVELLSNWNNGTSSKRLEDLFDTYILKGRNGKGNVKFTGYFSPIIEVSKTQTTDFQHPIYARPDDLEVIPTRSEILNGALKGQGLELAWAKSSKDIRNLQLQGSGYAKYSDGSVEYLAYGGNNARTRKNTYRAEKVSMSGNSGKKSKENTNVSPKPQNVRPGYTFFERSQKSKPMGAGSVHLTPEISVAVDSRLIPLGACLLAEFPVIDEKGRLLHHEYKIILAQDTGGAIKGAGHLDFYTGIGIAAEHKARYMSHYGRVWILMPKDLK
ncbi:MAG: MltA domain-containing protein [Saprospiraceae bacterium]|mgnify:FL=1